METQSNGWLPLTEYALRSGMSISTLRRKIKSNSIPYKMEDGRYLIRSDKSSERPAGASVSIEAPESAASMVRERTASLVREQASLGMGQLAEELRQYKEEDSMRWRALEARVSGLAKKLESFTEQMAEVKMLVKIFEEKLDRSV